MYASTPSPADAAVFWHPVLPPPPPPPRVSPSERSDAPAPPAQPASAATEPHRIPFFAAASDPRRQGLARIVNHADEAGTVRIDAFDDDGTQYGPLTLSIGARQSVDLDSSDLENGSPGKGWPAPPGPGEVPGAWRRPRRSSSKCWPTCARATASSPACTTSCRVPGGSPRRVLQPGPQREPDQPAAPDQPRRASRRGHHRGHRRPRRIARRRGASLAAGPGLAHADRAATGIRRGPGRRTGRRQVAAGGALGAADPGDEPAVEPHPAVSPTCPPRPTAPGSTGRAPPRPTTCRCSRRPPTPAARGSRGSSTTRTKPARCASTPSTTTASSTGRSPWTSARETASTSTPGPGERQPRQGAVGQHGTGNGGLAADPELPARPAGDVLRAHARRLPHRHARTSPHAPGAGPPRRVLQSGDNARQISRLRLINPGRGSGRDHHRGDRRQRRIARRPGAALAAGPVPRAR